MGFVKSYEEIVGNATESADFHEAEMLMAAWETKPEGERSSGIPRKWQTLN